MVVKQFRIWRSKDLSSFENQSLGIECQNCKGGGMIVTTVGPLNTKAELRFTPAMMSMIICRLSWPG